MSENESFLRNVLGEYMTTLGDKSSKVVIVNADQTDQDKDATLIFRDLEQTFNALDEALRSI